MKLLNGIAGFFNSPDNEPSNLDGKQFNKTCFTIIQQCKGEILDFKEPKYPSSFYDVETNVLNKHVHIRRSKSPILHRTLGNSYWSSQGLKSLLSRFEHLRQVS